MKLRALLYCLLAMTLTGCTTVHERVPVNDMQQIKRVSIVSIIGDEFVRTYIGVTVFGNEEHTLEQLLMSK